jgi:hypothetical protein
MWARPPGVTVAIEHNAEASSRVRAIVEMRDGATGRRNL